MSFKIADGYVEVHAKHDRASTRRNAEEAVEDAEEVGKQHEGSLLRWLFTSNPKLMRLIEAPLGSIFSSPYLFAAAAIFGTAVGGFLSTILTSAIFLGVTGGFVAAGAWVHANDKAVVGAYKSMTDKIKDVFYRASQPIVQPLIRAMGIIGKGFEKMEPAFSRIYQAIAPLIEPFTGGILGFIEAMLPGIERAMPGIQMAVLALAEHLPGLGTAFGDFIATLADNGPLIERAVGLMITWLENFLKVAGPLLVWFTASFVGMAIAWTWMMEQLKKFGGWVEDTWKKIPGWWDSTWGKVSGWFTGLGDDISNWWDDIASSISDWWDRTWGQVTTWFSELPGNIGNFLSELPGVMYGWWLQAFDTVFYLIGFALGSILGAIIAFVLSIPGNLQAGWDAVTSSVSATWDWIFTFISDTLDSIVDNVVDWFHDLIDWFERLPGRMHTAAINTWNTVYNAFFDGGGRVLQFVAGLPARIAVSISGIAHTLYNAGRDAIVGLINGIESLMGWAVDMAWRAARRIADGFLDALGIGSPSKVMAEEVGQWIPKGIVVGIDGNMSELEKRAGMFSDLFTGARPSFGGVGGASSPGMLDQSTNYGQIVMHINLDNIQELEDIKAFLDGKLSGTKANEWAGNIYEKTGEYERSYR